MSNYKIYHNSLTGAVQEVESFIEDQGYTVDPEELFHKVGAGPAKPTPGNTNKYHLELITAKGNIARKMAHFQVYNRGDEVPENMELNLYLS